MHLSRTIKTLAAAATSVAMAGPALAVDGLLDFPGNICGPAGNLVCTNGLQIGQNYGDIPLMVDISYRSLSATTGLTTDAFLKYWDTGYSGLTGVAWGGSDTGSFRSEIVFAPTTGLQVTINSFQFGDYLNSSSGSSVQIYDLAGTTLLWNGGAFNPGATPTTFTPAITARGLTLRWGPDGYNVGIDNISFSVTAVPEPSTLAFALAGAGLLTLRRLRRS